MENYSAVRRVESRRALARWKRDRQPGRGIVHPTDLGDETSKAEAVEYGKQLREQFYQSIFSDNGLDLNMARYNVGGGSASDAAYGYPFMRQGAAVPGTWKDDPTGFGTYGDDITTKQADKDKLAAAFDPKAGAAASDEEDGDLTDKILVEGSVNTEKAGEYTLTYSVTDSEGASYTVKRVVTVREKSEPIEPSKPIEPTELTKPTEPTKPGDTVKPNKPDAGNKQPGLSKTGASVSGVFGAFAALLAVGAGAALAARRRREPRR